MAEPERHDVVVVGGGPAGLAAAMKLRRRGVERVLVLEREPVAGGIPRHCGHSPFGMREFGRVLTGPTYAGRLRDQAGAAGVVIRTGHSVVALEQGGRITVATSDGPTSLAAGRVVLATGVREASRHARLISGDRPLGVVTTGTLQSMIHGRHLVPFRRPVVVGTELVSLSALLACRGARIRPVAMIEPRDRPTVRRAMMLFPRLLGIAVHLGADLVEIRGGRRVEGVLVRTADGRPLELACDGVLLTGRFLPEAALVRSSHLGLDPGTGGPAVDQFGRCTDPTYFAAGNLLRPVETAGWSFREGTRVGGCVADDLAGSLPQQSPALPIDRGHGVKLVVPQRLALPLGRGGLRHLQLRVDRPVGGGLDLLADGVPIWHRRTTALPERRLLVPLADIHLPPATRRLEIGFRP
ncbi:MAG: NAD(P)/FAD-dependent oxidoreductase [Geminicoccaceae bacterium]|jgi:thioredoxin reductase